MAAKFSMANGSIFGATDHLEASKRMENALQDLKIKKEIEENNLKLENDKRRANELLQQKEKKIIKNLKEYKETNEIVDNNENILNEENFDSDDDYELEKIRAKRLKELKQLHQVKIENISKGHGQYREIFQDEFLKEVTSSQYVAVHFYHNDFERCKIIDKHLSIISRYHLECKFLKINAEKAPFFVTKLTIRTLPTIVCFLNGVAYKDRIVGFENLSNHSEKGHEDEFPTSMLATSLAEIGVLNIDKVEDLNEHCEANQKDTIEE